MKDLLITLGILALLLLGIYFFSNLKEQYDTQEAISNRETAIVKKVVDGDTINVLLSGEIASIRLIGVDTPEKTTTRYGYTECYGEEATDYLSGLLFRGSKIELEYDQSQGLYDKHNRILAYIFLSGININEEIIKNGYGKEYTYNLPYRYQSEFIDAENYALKNKLGLREACGENTTDEESPTNATHIFSGNATQ